GPNPSETREAFGVRRQSEAATALLNSPAVAKAEQALQLHALSTRTGPTSATARSEVPQPGGLKASSMFARRISDSLVLSPSYPGGQESFRPPRMWQCRC